MSIYEQQYYSEEYSIHQIKMVSRGTSLVTILIIILFLLALIGTLSLVLQVFLGFSGITSFHNLPNSILLQERCTIEYYRYKYGQGLPLSKIVAYCSTITSTVSATMTLLLVTVFWCQHSKLFLNNNRRTGAFETRRFIMTTGHTQVLFVFASVATISALLPFHKYLQWVLLVNNDSCSLVTDRAEIIALTVLSGIMLFLACLSVLLIAFLNYQANQFYLQKHHLLDELPITDRRLYADPEIPEVISPFRPMRMEQPQTTNTPTLNQHQSEAPYDSKEQNRSAAEGGHVDNLQRVESVLYRPSSSLKLQSAVIER